MELRIIKSLPTHHLILAEIGHAVENKISLSYESSSHLFRFFLRILRNLGPVGDKLYTLRQL